VARNYIKTEQKLQLHDALKRMEPQYRQVLYLVYFEDLQNAQVAAVMGKSRKQIENLVYRAKRSLKSELEKEGFAYEDL
jgi:RNA polymerase sigma-70 factor (ECF subfamily)